MQNSKLNTTYLKDYLAPDFEVEGIDLHFELNEDKTIVHSVLKLCRNSIQGKHHCPLILQGEALKLISLHLDGRPLASHQYDLTPTSLSLNDVPDIFTLEVVTQIEPQKNTTLSGLYRSNNLYCTQCEAQGFRRITYYLDRPDVMAPFTTTIVADKTRYPILLSNGNKIDQGELSDNRHWVKWQDPFKKPCYLFALVAGDLAKIADTYTTMSGKKVALEIFVEPQNKEKCQYALESLKKSMQWDEQAYGREYDLDIYMIVAVNDFNMGAMENKGLNIFNSKYILASEKTATDIDFQNVEAVIGHEYFHNWTGNRITCRDWFQLSLKEGLTVFREQQFSASTGSSSVKRINDVRIIRTRQFAEDAGPMAHPVRPESYIEINNFYTTTIYNKGAEVIRMLHTMLGKDKFRKGMDLYFERHDGQAVTIEDFVAAFSDANNIDLTQFHRWYHQAGTPKVTVKEQYDPKTKQFKIALSQTCPITPDKKEKKPFVIPIKVALYDDNGKSIAIESKGHIEKTEQGYYLILDKESQEFVFENVPIKPVPSLLGDFSAPVKLFYPYTDAELALLMTCDEDLFNRWDAAQRVSTSAIKSLMSDFQQDKTFTTPTTFIEAYRELFKQNIADPALIAQLLSLPSFQYVAEDFPVIDVNALNQARKFLLQSFAEKLQDELANCYYAAQEADDGSLSGESMGYRALKNVCLYYLVRSSSQWLEVAQKQFKQAKNMTDMMGALSAINSSTSPIRQTLFEDFYQQFKNEPLVVNKWLSLQASADLPTVLDNIKNLLTHESFDIGNPNKVYALINTFGMANPERFHDDKGLGYEFLADRVIELNQRNPQVAARILEGLTQWKRIDEAHSALMKKALMKIEAVSDLSEDVYEIVTKSLVA
ncbi:MAG: aminopeptidase N [Gammaproteobacteria bacterium 39-13]|nr:aminopeptidase N [Gammaproteobacteria bacterium]OJV85595.1 MAG: aminopeptidase N [Gammaproteobacteria bacterium 39-13]